MIRSVPRAGQGRRDSGVRDRGGRVASPSRPDPASTLRTSPDRTEIRFPPAVGDRLGGRAPVAVHQLGGVLGVETEGIERWRSL